MAVARKERLNRAEEIRKRRAGETVNNGVQKRQRTQAMAVVRDTPIFVRQGLVGTPVVQRTRTQVKRKVAVPLQNGSEVVIPGLPILHPGWRLVSGFIALTLAALFILIAVTDVFDVSALSINGLQRVNAADIASILNLNGTPAFMLDPQEIQAEIETSFPEFYDINVEIVFPAVVNIHLSERSPVLAWKYDALTLWVDSEGNVFTPRGEADNLFTVKSSEAPPRIQVQMTDREIQIARELGILQSDDEILMKDGPVDPQLVRQILDLHERRPEITWLSYNPKSGFGWNDEKRDWNIYFGHDLDELDQKLLLYEAIKSYVMDKGIKINTISVAYTQAPFYRLEK